MNKNYVYPSTQLYKERNKFDMSHTHKTSFKHGLLVPLDFIEVYPGDTFKVDLACLLRMSTPIAPIMDNITMHVAAYWIPHRLVFENFEQLWGANKTGSWTTDTTQYRIPQVQVNCQAGDVGDYLGIPPYSGANPDYFSVIPGRAYYLVWNEHYRNQNVTAPLSVDHSINQNILLDTGLTGGNGYSIEPQKLGKYSDMFTKCLPQPQKHAPVPFIPQDIPVGVNSPSDLVSAYRNVNNSTVGLSGGFAALSLAKSDDSGTVGAIVASVDQAWNNINALRFAFQLQKFYEADARYGTRFIEVINGHYGVKNAEGLLQMSEFLGEFNFHINVDQVLSTAGYVAGNTTTVGAPGANSVTAKKGSLFTFSAGEPGIILIVGGTRHDHTYGQGKEKFWDRLDRLDFYDPVFANIGEQPILTKEIYDATPASRDVVFGYNEAWTELRQKKDRVSGLMNPSQNSSLGFWTLADEFAAAPLLNDTFIYENRDSIARALVTGSTGPDFIGDFFFKTTAVRELPLFSIPGLADHH